MRATLDAPSGIYAGSLREVVHMVRTLWFTMVHMVHHETFWSVHSGTLWRLCEVVHMVVRLHLNVVAR